MSWEGLIRENCDRDALIREKNKCVKISKLDIITSYERLIVSFKHQIALSNENYMKVS